MQQWAREGMLDIEQPRAFNRLMIPVLQQRNIVSSIHLATDEGRELLLLQTPTGWRNRLTDVPRHGKRQHWLSFADARTPTTEEWLEQDYDPRQRPWFAEALVTPENQIHWTSPYMFKTTGEPGITAVIRWHEPASGRRWISIACRRPAATRRSPTSRI